MPKGEDSTRGSRRQSTKVGLGTELPVPEPEQRRRETETPVRYQGRPLSQTALLNGPRERVSTAEMKQKAAQNSAQNETAEPVYLDWLSRLM